MVIAVVLLVASSPMPRLAVASDAASGLFHLPADESLSAATALDVNDTPMSPEEALTPEQVRDDAAARAAALPEAEWDIPRLADALDYDPERAFTFVRDSIGFDPYPGVLRGAEGTLAARAGNAWDRAMLLGALLAEMEVPVRYAFATLDDESATAIADRGLLAPVAPLTWPGIELTPMFDAASMETRASRDYAQLRTALGDRVSEMEGPESGGLIDDVRQHAWVQMAFGSEWRDLDPTLPDSSAGSVLTQATTVGDEIPVEAHQVVMTTVTAETLTEGTLTQTTLLEQTLDAAAASASEIFLYFEPAVEGVGGSIVEALSGDEDWTPVLMVDGEDLKGTAFRVGGRGTDVFGEETAAPDLVSLKLTVSQRGPSRDAVTATRVLLDRVPTELRGTPIVAEQLRALPADEAGPLVLGQVHHIMVSTGGADRRDYSIQRSRSADFAGSRLTSEEALFDYSWSDLLWPVAASDQSLVVASESAVVPALAEAGRVRSFVAAPRVFLATLGRDAQDPQSLAFELDLLLDDVALLAADGVATSEMAMRRLWYGVLQTALETEMGLRRAQLLDPASRALAGASLAGVGPLTILTGVDVATLDDGAPAALRDALAAGALVALRGDVAAAKTWWTVDPRNGAVRSVLDPGLGGVRQRGASSRAGTTRTADTVYGGGRAGRSARIGGHRPGNYGVRGASCRGASEYTVQICGVAVPGGLFLAGLGIGISIILMIVWYAI